MEFLTLQNDFAPSGSGYRLDLIVKIDTQMRIRLLVFRDIKPEYSEYSASLWNKVSGWMPIISINPEVKHLQNLPHPRDVFGEDSSPTMLEDVEHFSRRIAADMLLTSLRVLGKASTDIFSDHGVPLPVPRTPEDKVLDAVMYGGRDE